ncbi:RNA 3'-terminal phosphate cyclase [Pleionea sp. CnH1-48]|uniref:RNA 3'-terminal phosphate cyclase n=1 Tax=Pleionea sp. CnH1-48 TaxID=2954494 RepID=UPI002096F5B5|nr:RNA 3'-terminal phosphate cyclase [Pleionea sp. CnH1-48]MCO7225213.1 RNA 3'-terminal phosphate cyclase [Pleionea sp. CnH1-48]
MTIRINGAQGEGGGQILRSSLSLAAMTGQNIEIFNIRAGRHKPGLLRQHLTCVLAAAEICDAEVEGAELRSSFVRFKPGKIKGGQYHFKIGSAGSTTLVCQTVLPILMMADEESDITFEGGTHNGMSPSLDFLRSSFLPLMKRLGLSYEVHVEKLGFNPAGGGYWSLKMKPVKQLRELNLLETADESDYELSGVLSQLPENILTREFDTACRYLNWNPSTFNKHIEDGPGCGNALLLHLKQDGYHIVYEEVGQVGVKAENIAKRAAGKMKRFIRSGAAVDEYLADQLLLPMAMAGVGAFTTRKLSMHTQTNMDVIKLMTGIEFKTDKLDEDCWKIYVDKK